MLIFFQIKKTFKKLKLLNPKDQLLNLQTKDFFHTVHRSGSEQKNVPYLSELGLATLQLSFHYLRSRLVNTNIGSTRYRTVLYLDFDPEIRPIYTRILAFKHS